MILMTDLPEGVIRRIIGLELNFTDNKFGDKDVQLDRIVTRLVPVQQMEVLHGLPVISLLIYLVSVIRR